MSDAQIKIDEVNARLKIAQMPVALKLRGGRLSLVATLPPKPNSKKVRPFQQMVALGVPASNLGLKRAEREAMTVGVLLINGEFSWDRYLCAVGSAEPVRSLVARFERHHRQKNQISDSTWRFHYACYYRRLPQEEPLTIEAVMPLVFATKEHTRARQQICRQMQKLCNFSGLQVNLLQYQGRYSSQAGQMRDVPSDEEVVAGWEKMRSPQWRWVYGMMATFGLRDHECWFCSFVGDDLQISEGKTGERLIELPLYESWVEGWRLKDVRRPKLKIENGRQYLAEQCAQAFSRAGVGFPPYALRYAYGHRGTVLFRYEAGIMAHMMGHSTATHNRTYQRFLNADLVRKKVKEMKAREGLPTAPNVD